MEMPSSQTAIPDTIDRPLRIPQASPEGSNVLLALASSAIAIATLWPLSPEVARSGSPWCLFCGESTGRDAVLNVALFVPFGIALAQRGATTAWAAVASLLLSATVEMLQYTMVPGRDATISDVLANTLGGTLGAIAGEHLHLLFTPTAVQARWLTGAGAVLWIAVIGVSSWALVPDATETRQYWGQHAHVLPGFTPFRSQVTGAELNGLALPDGPVPGTPAVRAGILGGGYRLVVHVPAIAPVVGRAEIVALVDGENHFLALIEQRGCAATFSTRVRGQRLGLLPPVVRLPQACSREPVVLEASADRRQVSLTLTSDESSLSVRRRVTAAAGWALLLPEAALTGTEWLWSSLWLLVPLGLLGWWSRATGVQPGWLRWVLLTGSAWAGLAGAAMIWQLAPPALLEGALAGIAAATALLPERGAVSRP